MERLNQITQRITEWSKIHRVESTILASGLGLEVIAGMRVGLSGFPFAETTTLMGAGIASINRLQSRNRVERVLSEVEAAASITGNLMFQSGLQTNSPEFYLPGVLLGTAGGVVATIHCYWNAVGSMMEEPKVLNPQSC